MANLISILRSVNGALHPRLRKRYIPVPLLLSNPAGEGSGEYKSVFSFVFFASLAVEMRLLG
jgi:hypothetical protein